jgi:HSP20 family protein
MPYRDRGSMMRPEVLLFGPLHQEIDRLFDEFARGVAVPGAQGANLLPKIDVRDTDKDIQITAEMPGLQRDDVDISLEGNTLTIRGEKREERREEDPKSNLQVSERRYGVFLRAIELPEGIDPSSVQATMSNGVLTVTIPKPARSQPTKIEVKDGQ